MYKNQIKLLSKTNDNVLKSNAKKYKQLERLIENIEDYKTSINQTLIISLDSYNLLNIFKKDI